VAQMQYEILITEGPVVRDADLSMGRLLSQEQINVVHCQSAWDFARLAWVKIFPITRCDHISAIRERFYI
jgi:hypothetical protein